MAKPIDNISLEQEYKKKESGERYQAETKKFSVDELWGIYYDIAEKTYHYNFPDKDYFLNKVINKSHEGLSNGDRYWNVEKFPTFQEIFKVVMISTARNYRKKIRKDENRFISLEDIAILDPKVHPSYSRSFPLKPEDILINTESYEQANKDILSFIDFLEGEDEEVYKIIRCCHEQGIALSKDKELSSALNMQNSDIVNAKRRITRLRRKFVSQLGR